MASSVDLRWDQEELELEKELGLHEDMLVWVSSSQGPWDSGP